MPLCFVQMNGLISLALQSCSRCCVCSRYAHESTWDLFACVYTRVPGQQYALIFLQLSHKWGVRFGHSSTLLDVIKGFFQIPAVLLHGVRDHRGCRATYSHLTVHQALRSCFPGVDMKNQIYLAVFQNEAYSSKWNMQSCQTHLALDINL